MVVIIKKGENVNVYHAGFDDDNGFHHPKEGECECISCRFDGAKVLPKDGCHHQKGGECESCGFW